ncbi:hypothetical protein IMPR6_140030 [Imperialibacter sp. EC-SDR9]|nr:hypothetical protein IMPERIA89_130030 [Imperialibacter sp. 89]CAD5265145.1 hypothetical protein IMPERIA75_300009 [Imperialibacter sp. 75]VVT03281.1 hypothetical protein IMPR6_140030 [Imperialibacter sp. EC-SDR9]
MLSEYSNVNPDRTNVALCGRQVEICSSGIASSESEEPQNVNKISSGRYVNFRRI